MPAPADAFQAGVEYWQAQRWVRAERAFALALAHNPADAHARFNHAAALKILGRLDEAVAGYRALAGTTLWSAALAAVAGLRPESITDDEQALLARDETAASQFALGRLLDRQGDHDAAFEAFAKGNGLHRATLGDAPERLAATHAAVIQSVRTTFTADFIRHHQGAGHPSKAPIFIVGMPRSGSTLLEQILTSHGDVRSVGEVNAFAQTVNGRFPYPLNAPSGPDHFRRLGGDYLSALRGLGWKSSRRVIDKTLRNDVAIGSIHLMFPGAAILESLRDPVGACLSNYMQLFSDGNEIAYDLADIGRHYRRHRETMDHWAEVLPGRVNTIGHEALVADQEGGTRALLAACGLGWEPACLDFHKTNRPVGTASAAQVRQPMFTASVRRRRDYERHLGPLYDALGPYAHA